MADTSTKTKVQGGALLDALSKLLFKGIDKIFDAASEYQKEYGVLKQVTKIPVQDRKGKEYTLVVKLSPIKDKEGLYYVEIECPGYDSLAADSVNKKTIKLNKDNRDDFKNVIGRVMNLSHLRPVKKEEEGEEAEKENANNFMFYNPDDDSECEVYVEVDAPEGGSKVTVTATGDPTLDVPFEKSISTDDLDTNLGDELTKHLKKQCNLVPLGEDSARWEEFVTYLNNINDQEAIEEPGEEPEEENANASIKVTLEKITANGHEDINLISISCAEKINIIQDIVASDEFVDSMPEGESSYQIIEEDDDYDITQI